MARRRFQDVSDRDLASFRRPSGHRFLLRHRRRSVARHASAILRKVAARTSACDRIVEQLPPHWR